MINKVFLSIDFEDKSYDLKRKLNINKKIDSREKSLWNSYEKINNFLSKSLNAKKITFFCTGVLAANFPDLIKQISNDGHEIASHYFYHDKVETERIDIFEKNLLRSIELLESLTNKKVIGFRAPD